MQIEVPVHPSEAIIIDGGRPYIAIEDLAYQTQLFQDSSHSSDPQEWENRLHEIQRRHAPNRSTFVSIGARAINEQLEAIAIDKIKNNGHGVVHLDRYIGSQATEQAFFRLNLSRNTDNKIVSRNGTSESPTQQFDDVGLWAQKNDIEAITLMDDVLTFGNTLPFIISELQDRLPHTAFHILVGIAASGGVWNGLERIRDECSIEPEYLIKAVPGEAEVGGTKGMALPVSRDLTIFGGKAGLNGLSYPYFLPFCIPQASIIRSESVIEASQELLDFNIDLVAQLSQNRTPLTIGEMLLHNCGTPYTNIEGLEQALDLPDHQTTAVDYLNSCRDAVTDNRSVIERKIEEKSL